LFRAQCAESGDQNRYLTSERRTLPFGYSFRGKQWLEHDNPNAVGMSGLLEFLPGKSVKKVQIDRNPKHIGRRTAVDMGLVGDVKATVTTLLKSVTVKSDASFLEKQVVHTKSFHELVQHYVVKGPGIKPIRPEFLAATLSQVAADDAMFFADHRHGMHMASKAHQRRQKSQAFRLVLLGVHGQCRAQCVRRATGISRPADEAICGDGGFTMLDLGDLLTQVERKTPVVQIILNNGSLDFVNIEQQEAGFVPFGVEFKNPNFAKVAEAMGAKGIRIEEPGDVREGLTAALAHKGGPVVVDAVVDPFALSLPSHVPFHTAKGFTLSLAKQVWNGKMDAVIKTAERNIRLI
jgi:pyruvate dehydrogenase (quinone)